MGIESIGGATGAQSYQSTGVTKPVQDAAPVTEGSMDAAQTSQSAVSNQAVAVGQSTTTDNQNDGGQPEKQSPKQQKATMKDVNELNKLINQNTVAEFGYNEPTNRITIKIKDKETDEVIKEIPSEKALEMLAKVWELAGILVDEKR